MIAKNLTIAIAESCTGGLLTSYLTSIEGASKYFAYGFITYSNQAKIDLLNVSPQTIERFGAVSKETAEAMALGGITKADSSIAIAITGIAGPQGGTPQKPVGTVWIAIAAQKEILTQNSYSSPLAVLHEFQESDLVLRTECAIDNTHKYVSTHRPDKIKKQLLKAEEYNKIAGKKLPELSSINHKLVTKSYSYNFDFVTQRVISQDNRRIIRYLSCKKALQIILKNIN